MASDLKQMIPIFEAFRYDVQTATATPVASEQVREGACSDIIHPRSRQNGAIGTAAAVQGLGAGALKPIILACVMAALSGGFAFAENAGELSDSACQRSKQAAFETPLAVTAKPMTIVAIGSSSTEGIARNAKDKLYPSAMQAALKTYWPGADVTVVNKGRGGEVMAETLRRFETDVLALKPAMVIWQLGVNDVLRFQGVEGRQAEIKAGLDILARHAVPVILLDLQYAPLVTKDPDALPMQKLIDGAVHNGVKGRVFHFRRFALMKELADKQAVSMAAMTDGDGLHMTDAMHTCVGKLLADMVATSAQNARKVAIANSP